MQIINGDKTLHYTDSYMTNTNDFRELSKETTKNRQESASSFDHIAIDTKQINHIDVDTFEHEAFVQDMKNRLPYFESARKKLPHVSVKFNDPIEGLRVESVLDKQIEVLSGMWSLCPLDALVYNADKEIGSLSNNFLKTEQDKFIENIANKHDTVPFDKIHCR